jgi:hypothetical protein
LHFIHQQRNSVTARLLTAEERAFWYNRSDLALNALPYASFSQAIRLRAYVLYDAFCVWRRLYGTASAEPLRASARKQVAGACGCAGGVV